MSSPMPMVQGSCCYCYDPIPPGEFVVDHEGAPWDCHKGRCAERIGIYDGFDSTPPVNYYPEGDL